MTSPNPVNRIIFRIAFTLTGIGATVIPSTLESLTTYFQIPLENGGFFTAAFFIGASLAVFIGGRLLDANMSRPLSMSGAGLLGISLVILAIIPSNLAVLGFVSVAFLGIGHGLLVVCGNTLAPRYNPEHPARELSAINFFFGIGAIMGPQVASLGLNNGDFRLIYWWAGAIGIIVAGVFIFMPNFAPAKKSDSSAKIMWASLFPFGILLFVYVGVEIGFSSWISPQMTLVALSTATVGSLAISLFWAGLTAGRFIASFIAGRISNELLLLMGISMVAIGAGGVLVFPSNETILLALSFVAGFGCAPVFPLTLAILNRRYAEGFGRVSGLIIAIGNSGAIFLPTIQGQVGAGQNGGMIVPLLGAGVMFICASLIMRTKSA
ncbi:MAG: MFS transporter [Anaerolineae bacterium]|nr:MFS transporter [Anaerolineae bacterium]